jgi:signal transduction histidine kinase
MIEKERQLVLDLKKSLSKEKEIVELKSRFVSVASHEFRTPLAVIQSATDILRNFSQKITPQEKNQCFERIDYQIMHLTRMIDDVLHFSKIEGGLTVVNADKILLEDFFQNFLQDFVQFNYKHQDFKIEALNLHLTIISDAEALKTIYSNLITNAVKYSRPFSRIEILLELRVLQKELFFQIKDYGQGIPQEEIREIFVPFHRAKNIVEIPGTGLGLSIVKTLLDKINGQIEVESLPNKFTEFTVRIPVLLTEDNSG